MSTNVKRQMITRSQPAGAELRLKELGIELPEPPEPFGTYVESVQTGNLLFLSGMLPTEGHEAKFIGRVGAELDVEAGRNAAHRAALNARSHVWLVLMITREDSDFYRRAASGGMKVLDRLIGANERHVAAGRPRWAAEVGWYAALDRCRWLRLRPSRRQCQ